MSEDLPAPFSPSKAWTSPLRTSRSAAAMARKPSNDLDMPESSRAEVITLSTESQVPSLLTDDALDEPVHFPEIGIRQHLPRRDTFLAVAIGERTGIDLLAVHDRLALGG